jgi:tRNA (cytidine/uridine-2'-O-)-methyltransferase
MNIVLVEPDIPQNTGNIVRTCAATGTNLHLIRPLGFLTEDKYLKRAGLDYWDKVEIFFYDSIEDLSNKFKANTFYYSSTKAIHNYNEINYKYDDFIFFGKETAGLPEELLKNNLDHSIRIPMKDNIRSLNIANSVAIILFEALRQLNFPDLVLKGKFND